MDLGISGKKVFITGVGKGLGASAAHILHREGCQVVANSRDFSTLQALPCTLTYAADLSATDSVKNAMHFLEEHQAIPDILIHNLGGNLGITDPLCSVDEWKQVMRFNLEIAVEFNQLIIPHMQKKGWGRICHISSIAGLENQGPPSYCAAKAGLIAYTRSLGRFVAKDGIVMTSVLPGAVMTEGGYWDIASQERPEHVAKYLTERMAIGRFGRPEEIGEIIAFLCSDLASFCIGSSLLVDGGQGRVFYA